MTNKISRKKSRKFLFQKLFSDSYAKTDQSDFRDSFLIDSFRDNLDDKYLEEMEKLIKEKELYLIELIKMYAPKFVPENMSLTYVIPIFIGATEMLYLPEEIPAKVSMNEAIEIAKVYWDESAKKIVNWVLNNLYKNYDEINKRLNDLKTEDNFSFFKK